MPKGMGADSLSHSAPCGRALHDIPYGSRRKASAVCVKDEESFLRGIADLPGTNVLHVGLGEIARPLTHGDHTVLSSLAVDDEQLVAAHTEVSDVQVRK